MTTLADFLLARIAEDEARARTSYRVIDPHRRVWQRPDDIEVDGEVMSHAEYLERFCEPALDARALARCKAHRQIVELHAQHPYAPDECSMCSTHASLWPCSTLRALALPYAAHPDYREEWARERE